MLGARVGGGGGVGWVDELVEEWNGRCRSSRIKSKLCQEDMTINRSTASTASSGGDSSGGGSFMFKGGEGVVPSMKLEIVSNEFVKHPSFPGHPLFGTVISVVMSGGVVMSRGSSMSGGDTKCVNKMS